MEIIDHSHTDAQLGANVQGKENPFGFFCTKCTIYHKCKPLIAGDTHHDAYIHHAAPALCKTKELAQGYGCRPNRCSDCAKDVKSWIRTEEWKKKLKESFSLRRHRFIRMLTLGLPGQKIFQEDEIEKQTLEFRNTLVENFKKLRARNIWKDCVDGGMWFYEYTLDIVEGGVKINPHLHMVVLASKMVPIADMNDYIERSGFNNETKGIQLGRIHVSTTRDKKGRIKKTSPSDAINYCVNYLKKDTQSNGKNRHTFGNQFG